MSVVNVILNLFILYIIINIYIYFIFLFFFFWGGIFTKARETEIRLKSAEYHTWL